MAVRWITNRSCQPFSSWRSDSLCGADMWTPSYIVCEKQFRDRLRDSKQPISNFERKKRVVNGKLCPPVLMLALTISANKMNPRINITHSGGAKEEEAKEKRDEKDPRRPLKRSRVCAKSFELVVGVIRIAFAFIGKNLELELFAKELRLASFQDCQRRFGRLTHPLDCLRFSQN